MSSYVLFVDIGPEIPTHIKQFFAHYVRIGFNKIYVISHLKKSQENTLSSFFKTDDFTGCNFFIIHDKKVDKSGNKSRPQCSLAPVSSLLQAKGGGDDEDEESSLSSSDIARARPDAADTFLKNTMSKIYSGPLEDERGWCLFVRYNEFLMLKGVDVKGGNTLVKQWTDSFKWNCKRIVLPCKHVNEFRSFLRLGRKTRKPVLTYAPGDTATMLSTHKWNTLNPNEGPSMYVSEWPDTRRIREYVGFLKSTDVEELTQFLNQTEWASAEELLIALPPGYPDEKLRDFLQSAIIGGDVLDQDQQDNLIEKYHEKFPAPPEEEEEEEEETDDEPYDAPAASIPITADIAPPSTVPATFDHPVLSSNGVAPSTAVPVTADIPSSPAASIPITADIAPPAHSPAHVPATPPPAHSPVTADIASAPATGQEGEDADTFTVPYFLKQIAAAKTAKDGLDRLINQTSVMWQTNETVEDDACRQFACKFHAALVQKFGHDAAPSIAETMKAMKNWHTDRLNEFKQFFITQKALGLRGKTAVNKLFHEKYFLWNKDCQLSNDALAEDVMTVYEQVYGKPLDMELVDVVDALQTKFMNLATKDELESNSVGASAKTRGYDSSGDEIRAKIKNHSGKVDTPFITSCFDEYLRGKSFQSSELALNTLASNFAKTINAKGGNNLDCANAAIEAIKKNMGKCNESFHEALCIFGRKTQPMKMSDDEINHLRDDLVAKYKSKKMSDQDWADLFSEFLSKVQPETELGAKDILCERFGAFIWDKGDILTPFIPLKAALAEYLKDQYFEFPQTEYDDLLYLQCPTPAIYSIHNAFKTITGAMFKGASAPSIPPHAHKHIECLRNDLLDRSDISPDMIINTFRNIIKESGAKTPDEALGIVCQYFSKNDRQLFKTDDPELEFARHLNTTLARTFGKDVFKDTPKETVEKIRKAPSPVPAQSAGNDSSPQSHEKESDSLHSFASLKQTDSSVCDESHVPLVHPCDKIREEILSKKDRTDDDIVDALVEFLNESGVEKNQIKAADIICQYFANDIKSFYPNESSAQLHFARVGAKAISKYAGHNIFFIVLLSKISKYSKDGATKKGSDESLPFVADEYGAREARGEDDVSLFTKYLRKLGPKTPEEAVYYIIEKYYYRYATNTKTANKSLEDDIITSVGSLFGAATFDRDRLVTKLRYDFIGHWLKQCYGEKWWEKKFSEIRATLADVQKICGPVISSNDEETVTKAIEAIYFFQKRLDNICKDAVTPVLLTRGFATLDTMEDGLVNHVRQKRIGVDNIVSTNITAYIQDIVEACVAWKQTSFEHIVSSCLRVIARVINEGDLVTRVNQDGFSVRLLTTEYRMNHPQEQLNTYLLFDEAGYQRRVADLVIVEIIRSKLHEVHGDKWDKEIVRSMLLETIEDVIVEYDFVDVDEQWVDIIIDLAKAAQAQYRDRWVRIVGEHVSMTHYWVISVDEMPKGLVFDKLQDFIIDGLAKEIFSDDGSSSSDSDSDSSSDGPVARGGTPSELHDAALRTSSSLVRANTIGAFNPLLTDSPVLPTPSLPASSPQKDEEKSMERVMCKQVVEDMEKDHPGKIKDDLILRRPVKMSRQKAQSLVDLFFNREFPPKESLEEAVARLLEERYPNKSFVSVEVKKLAFDITSHLAMKYPMKTIEDEIIKYINKTCEEFSRNTLQTQQYPLAIKDFLERIAGDEFWHEDEENRVFKVSLAAQELGLELDNPRETLKIIDLMRVDPVKPPEDPSPKIPESLTKLRETLVSRGRPSPSRTQSRVKVARPSSPKDAPAQIKKNEQARDPKDKRVPSPQKDGGKKSETKDAPAPPPVHEPVTPKPIPAHPSSIPAVSTPPVHEPVKKHPKELFKAPSTSRLNMALAERIAGRYFRDCDEKVSFQDFARKEYGVMYTFEDVRDIFKHLDEKVQRIDSKPSIFSEIRDDDVLIFVPTQ